MNKKVEISKQRNWTMIEYKCGWCEILFKDTPTSRRKFCSRKCKEQWQSSKPELASRWKGKDGKTPNVHRWVDKVKGGRPESCEECHAIPGKGKDGRAKIHWANLSGKYKRDALDWKALCISCHWRYDKPWLKRKRNEFGKFL